MNSSIIEMSNLMFDIKDKIKDGEYMIIMEKLSKIYTTYNAEIIDNICECEVYSNTFCINNLKYFAKCKNLQHTLYRFPILRNLLIIFVLPCTWTYDEDYKARNFYKSYIQYKIINQEKIYSDIEKADIIATVRIFLDFANNLHERLPKCFVFIQLYSYIFTNYKLFINSFKFTSITYSKLVELTIAQTERSYAPHVNLLKKLYNFNKLPFTMFKDNMTLFYEKEIKKESNSIQSPIPIPNREAAPEAPEAPEAPTVIIVDKRKRRAHRI